MHLSLNSLEVIIKSLEMVMEHLRREEQRGEILNPMETTLMPFLSMMLMALIIITRSPNFFFLFLFK